jgi:hypothetical protein
MAQAPPAPPPVRLAAVWLAVVRPALDVASGRPAFPVLGDPAEALDLPVGGPVSGGGPASGDGPVPGAAGDVWTGAGPTGAGGPVPGLARRGTVGGPVRAQPWASGRPSWPVRVRHHLVPGWLARASAKVRESIASSGPYPVAWPGSCERSSQVASGRVRFTEPLTAKTAEGADVPGMPERSAAPGSPQDPERLPEPGSPPDPESAPEPG